MSKEQYVPATSNHLFDTVDRLNASESAHTRRTLVNGTAAARGSMGLLGQKEEDDRHAGRLQDPRRRDRPRVGGFGFAKPGSKPGTAYSSTTSRRGPPSTRPSTRSRSRGPCASYEEMASLRGRVRHPVILDEIVETPAIAMRAIVEGVADGFGLKMTRVGGIGAMAAIRDMCRARRVPHTCDDSWGGDIVAATCVHIAATVEPRLLAGVWIAAPHIAEHLDPVRPVVASAGRIAVPTGPGLGVEPDVGSWPDPVASYSS